MHSPDVAAGVPLAPLTTLGVGGPARWMLTATSAADVEAAHAWAQARGVALVVLGGGSNVVVADRGIDALVLRIALRGIRVEPQTDSALLHAAAGEPWDDVVAEAVRRGLGGIECLSGIPGTAGGTPVQNVGAYGQEVAGTVTHVTAFDRTSGDVVRLDREACGFAYRASRFKGVDAGRFIVCAVAFRLTHAAGPTVAYPDLERYLVERGRTAPSLGEVREAVVAIRRRKGMVLDPGDADTRSVGSFFMNPVVDAPVHAALPATDGRPAPGFVLADGRVKVPAAWLIEQAGCGRGFRHGCAGVSTRHPLALVNRGGATAAEIVSLAVHVKRAVHDRFGISLRPEPVFLGFDDDADVYYLREG